MSEGNEYVITNGRFTVDDGQVARSLPDVVVRRP